MVKTRLAEVPGTISAHTVARSEAFQYCKMRNDVRHAWHQHLEKESPQRILPKGIL